MVYESQRNLEKVKYLESKRNFMREIKFKEVFRPSAELLFFYI